MKQQPGKVGPVRFMFYFAMAIFCDYVNYAKFRVYILDWRLLILIVLIIVSLKLQLFALSALILLTDFFLNAPLPYNYGDTENDRYTAEVEIDELTMRAMYIVIFKNKRVLCSLKWPHGGNATFLPYVLYKINGSNPNKTDALFKKFSKFYKIPVSSQKQGNRY